MSNTQNSVCRHRNRHILTISSLFLLVSSFTHQRISMVEGRPVSKLIEASQRKVGQVEENKVVAARARPIGSRPPRCARRCSACARCEAVQVPVAPQQRLRNTHSHTIVSRSSSSRSRSSSGTISETNYNGKRLAYYSSSDGFSNYKPISWKCKCGNFLYNP